MASVADLGKAVKAKHPGAYDDMDDADLGRSVKAKFPGDYDDFADEGSGGVGAPESRWSQKLGEGMLPGFNRVSAAAAATLSPVVPRRNPETGEWEIVNRGDTWGERYENELAANQGQSAETQREAPIASTALQVAGALPTAAVTSGAAPVGRLPSALEGVRQGSALGTAYAAGDTRARDVSGVVADAAGGAVVGGALGGAMGTVMPGQAPVPQIPGVTPKAPNPFGAVGEYAVSKIDAARNRVADVARQNAGERNLKAAGAIQNDITRSRKQLGPGGANDGRAELLGVGAEMGEKGLVGRTSNAVNPRGTFDKSVAMMDDAGGRMGQILADADRAGGASPTVQGIVGGGEEILARLQANPHTASAGDPAHAGHGGGHSAADQFGGLLARYRRIYGDRPLTFEEAHRIRMNIDKDLYGLRGTKDPWADSYKAALREFRGVVSNQIESSLDAATANSSAWKAANRDYQVAAKALEFADKGLDRGQGNNRISPSEMLMMLGGALGGSPMGTPGSAGGALALGAGTALGRRYYSGNAGANWSALERFLRAHPDAPVPATTPEALTPALVEWLRTRYGLSPAAAAAEGDAP
jgi:hypothetical protein